MKQVCDLLEGCEFYRTFKKRKSLVWKNIIGTYCKGFLFKKCERRGYNMISGESPPETLSPTGKVPEIFLSLP